ncbi:DUF5050 domain-containing protein [Clostridium sp. JNZ J1-5]
MKKLFKSLTTLIVLTILFSSTVFAISKSEAKVFEKRTNIEPNKQWLIKCNLQLDSSSIKENIYVFDKNRNKINITVTMNQDSKSFIVQAPKEGYKYGETYSLEISSSAGEIKSTSGKVMSQDVLMQFTIKDDPNTNVTEVKGNTAGNMINSGKMATSGDWIYYDDPNLNGFYKMKFDGSSKTLLNKDNPDSINIVGNWIYYNNQNDLGLYKMKLDGTGKTKIIGEEVMNVLVVNDWIYYISLSYDNQEYLCKVKLDGSSRTTLYAGRTFGFDVSDGWIYYSVYGDNTGLYKAKLDGTQKTTLLGKLPPTKLAISNGYIYYYDRTDEGRLYKISVNGNGKLKLTNNNVSKPNVIGNYVYYINFVPDSSKRVLHRVKVDGTGDTALDNTEINTIISAGEWIYCYGYNGIFFKIKPDGTGKQFIK